MWNTWRIDSVDDVVKVFGLDLNAVDFTLNWCFLSTSGVHGSYCTLDDLQRYFDDPEKFCAEENSGEPYEPNITITIVQPRIVRMGSGSLRIEPTDIPYLRDLVGKTFMGVAKSQIENLPQEHPRG